MITGHSPGWTTTTTLPTMAGGTIMRDLFDFAEPRGLLGRVAERLVLTRYLGRFLEARNQAIKAAAECDAWRRFVPAV